MTRYSIQRGSSQKTRTQKNPLALGTFTQTSLRLLKGELSAEYQVQKDGYGGGSSNHWFLIEIASPAWIILRKGGANAKYIKVSLYDLNHAPIEGRSIFQADSVRGVLIENDPNQQEYYPYVDQVMGAQSDLYNTFNPARLDLGDERYYTLSTGKYLICISTTRNEPRSYELGVVVEFPSEELTLLLEDLDGSRLALQDQLDALNTLFIGPIFSVDFTIFAGFNAFTEISATINSGVTVEIPSNSTWFIGLASGALAPQNYSNTLSIGPIFTVNFTIFAGFIAFTETSATINSGVTVEIPSTSTWVIGPAPEVTAPVAAPQNIIPSSDVFLLDPSPTFDYNSTHEHSLSEWKTAWEREHQETDKFPSILALLAIRP
jgi:hypothetical protein